MGKGPWFPWVTVLAASGTLAAIVWVPEPERWWCAGSLAAAYLVITGIGVYAVGINYFGRAVLRGKPGRKRIALTFDDGPDAQVTPVLLDLLKKHGAHASFFCVGQKAEANAEIARRIVEEGHTLGNHSYAHHWWTNFLVKGPLSKEVGKTQKVLRELSGVSPRYYRSPMGLSSPHLASALRELGLTLVAWNVRPFDRGKTAQVILARVSKGLDKAPEGGDGSIVLLHDGGIPSNQLPLAVGEILDRYQARGYSFVSLDELLVD